MEEKHSFGMSSKCFLSHHSQLLIFLSGKGFSISTFPIFFSKNLSRSCKSSSMADANAIPQTSKPEKQVKEATSSGHVNSSKSLSHFLCRAAFATVFLVLLPLFPAQAPEFISQTLYASRSWELLHLVFVGIAVSYGLFSKKNEDTAEKDQSSKLDNAQSYVSKLLHVSSVFDDEAEGGTVIDENNNNSSSINEVQTWNSHYYRVEKTPSPTPGIISQKPLLLPVRSLKQRVVPDQMEAFKNDPAMENCSVNRSSSNFGSKKFTSSSSGKLRNRELGGMMSSQKLEEEDVMVLRSPIPWRSRSGRIRMEKKEDGDGFSPPYSAQLNKLEPRSLKLKSPSPSFSCNGEEDVTRNKNFPPSPVPPPPPPPLPSLRNSRLMKSNSSSPVMRNICSSSSQQELRRCQSARDVPTEEKEEEPPELKGKSQNDVCLQLGKSVGTYTTSVESVKGADEKKSTHDCEAQFVERKEYKAKIKPCGNLADEAILVETTDDDDDSNSVGETEIKHGFEGTPSENHIGGPANNSVNDVGPDVDKKADEFIAKFREQIRLQRIESIRRSTAQRAGKALR